MKVRALIMEVVEVEISDEWYQSNAFKSDAILRAVLHDDPTVIDIACLDHDTDADKLKERADLRLQGIV